MKSVQKIILPLLVAVVVVLIYLTYFLPQKGLGSFSDFDTNSSASKEIKVKLLLEKGINRDSLNGITIFYAVDKNGTEIPVQAPLEVPENIRSGQRIILKGHLHPDHFHAVEVILE